MRWEVRYSPGGKSSEPVLSTRKDSDCPRHGHDTSPVKTVLGTVLYGTVLYYTVLYYSVLYYTVLSSNVRIMIIMSAGSLNTPAQSAEVTLTKGERQQAAGGSLNIKVPKSIEEVPFRLELIGEYDDTWYSPGARTFGF